MRLSTFHSPHSILPSAYDAHGANEIGRPLMKADACVISSRLTRDVAAAWSISEIRSRNVMANCSPGSDSSRLIECNLLSRYDWLTPVFDSLDDSRSIHACRGLLTDVPRCDVWLSDIDSRICINAELWSSNVPVSVLAGSTNCHRRRSVRTRMMLAFHDVQLVSVRRLHLINDVDCTDAGVGVGVGIGGDVTDDDDDDDDDRPVRGDPGARGGWSVDDVNLTLSDPVASLAANPAGNSTDDWPCEDGANVVAARLDLPSWISSSISARC
jgi:hypothetical protein